MKSVGTHRAWRSVAAVLCGIALTGSPLIAWADDAPASATTLWYVQGNIGTGRQHMPADTGITSGLGGIGSATAGKVALGYMLGAHHGVEVSYTRYGGTVDTPLGSSLHVGTQVVALQAVFDCSLTSAWTLNGRLGVAASRSRLDIPSLGYGASSNRYPVVAGVGVRYALSPHAEAVLDYDFHGATGKFASGGRQLNQLLSVGLRYRF